MTAMATPISTTLIQVACEADKMIPEFADQGQRRNPQRECHAVQLVLQVKQSTHRRTHGRKEQQHHADLRPGSAHLPPQHCRQQHGAQRPEQEEGREKPAMTTEGVLADHAP
jgi:hypothetical protein